MDFATDPVHDEIRHAVRKVCSQFPDDYWMHRDEDHEFPWEFYAAIVRGGWLGLTIPEEYGGLGLGKIAMCVVTEELSRGYIGVGSLGTRAEIAAWRELSAPEKVRIVASLPQRTAMNAQLQRNR